MWKYSQNTLKYLQCKYMYISRQIWNHQKSHVSVSLRLSFSCTDQGKVNYVFLLSFLLEINYSSLHILKILFTRQWPLEGKFKCFYATAAWARPYTNATCGKSVLAIRNTSFFPTQPKFNTKKIENLAGLSFLKLLENVCPFTEPWTRWDRHALNRPVGPNFAACCEGRGGGCDVEPWCRRIESEKIHLMLFLCFMLKSTKIETQHCLAKLFSKF